MWRYLAALAAVSAFAATKPQSLAEIRFETPPGWSARQVNERQIVVSAPGATDKRYERLIVAVCPELEGELARQFRSAVAELTRGRTIVSASPGESGRSRIGVEYLTERARVAEQAGTPVVTIFAGMQVNGGLVLAALLASDETMLESSVLTRFIDSVSANAVRRTTGSQPGVVSGNVYDAQGRPLRIPGARILVHIWGAGAGGDRVGFDIPVDAAGHYESRVPHGLYGFHARAYLPLNGRTVCVDLAPIDGRPAEQALDSTPGIVRDFALRLTGPIGGGNSDTIQGYYGGSLTVTDGANWKNPVFGAMARRYPGAKVVVSMQPIGPAVDGSMPQPIRYEYDAQKISTGEHKVNIPLAAYRVSALLVAADGTRRPLRVALQPQLAYAPTVDLLYGPDPDDHDGRPARPNLFVID